MSTASRLPHRRSRALLLHSVVRCSCTLSSASAPIGVAQGRCHGARGAVCGCGCSCLPGARAGAGAGARAQVRVVHRGLELIAHGLQCVAQLQPDWHPRAQLQHRAHRGAHLLRMSRPDDLPCQPPPSPTQPLPPCPLRCPALSAPLSEPTATPSPTLNAWPSASPTVALRELFRPPRSASSLSPALTRAQRHSHPLSRQMARGWRAAVPWRSAGPSSAW